MVLACGDRFMELHPQHDTDPDPFPKLQWTDTDDAKTDLEHARLEKIRALSETERLRTGLMDGTFFQQEDVERYLCACLSIIRSKMYAAPSRHAANFTGIQDAEHIKRDLLDYKRKLLGELPKFDPEQFKAKEFIATDVGEGAEFIQPDDPDDPENETPEDDASEDIEETINGDEEEDAD